MVKLIRFSLAIILLTLFACQQQLQQQQQSMVVSLSANKLSSPNESLFGLEISKKLDLKQCKGIEWLCGTDISSEYRELKVALIIDNSTSLRDYFDPNIQKSIWGKIREFTEEITLLSEIADIELYCFNTKTAFLRYKLSTRQDVAEAIEECKINLVEVEGHSGYITLLQKVKNLNEQNYITILIGDGTLGQCQSEDKEAEKKKENMIRNNIKKLKSLSSNVGEDSLFVFFTPLVDKVGRVELQKCSKYINGQKTPNFWGNLLSSRLVFLSDLDTSFVELIGDKLFALIQKKSLPRLNNKINYIGYYRKERIGFEETIYALYKLDRYKTKELLMQYFSSNKAQFTLACMDNTLICLEKVHFELQALNEATSQEHLLPSFLQNIQEQIRKSIEGYGWYQYKEIFKWKVKRGKLIKEERVFSNLTEALRTLNHPLTSCTIKNNIEEISSICQVEVCLGIYPSEETQAENALDFVCWLIQPDTEAFVKFYAPDSIQITIEKTKSEMENRTEQYTVSLKVFFIWKNDRSSERAQWVYEKLKSRNIDLTLRTDWFEGKPCIANAPSHPIANRNSKDPTKWRYIIPLFRYIGKLEFDGYNNAIIWKKEEFQEPALLLRPEGDETFVELHLEVEGASVSYNAKLTSKCQGGG